MEKISKAENILQTEDSENEFDVSDLDDIEPYDNSKESYDFNFEREDFNRQIPELLVDSIQQQSPIIGYDFIKMQFPLIYSKEARFAVNRHSFFRTNKPSIPARKDESILVMYAEDKHYCKMLLTENERLKLKTEEYEKESIKRTKLIFPNAKPFYNNDNHLLGLGHMYFADGNFIVSISGKIVSSTGILGLLTLDTIDEALDEIKSTGLVSFDNDVFRKKAIILGTHVTNDNTVPYINTSVRAFSSYLPMRTDRYNVLKYDNCGYEILPRGKQSNQVPKYEFCIYNKGLEIREHNQKSYIKRIGNSGMSLANNTLRMELRLLNFPAIRKFLAPEKKNGTLTLDELLSCQQKPIIQMLSLLNITTDSLKDSRGKYITMVEECYSPTQAEFERMHGLIRLLELHDYNLDKVRSYVEVETGQKTSSNYFTEKRDILQRYITCYMPKTVATLIELLSGMNGTKGYIEMKDIPNSEGVPNKVTPEFNEDVLDFLTLLVEEYLRVEKLNKPPPE